MPQQARSERLPVSGHQVISGQTNNLPSGTWPSVLIGADLLLSDLAFPSNFKRRSEPLVLSAGIHGFSGTFSQFKLEDLDKKAFVSWLAILYKPEWLVVDVGGLLWIICHIYIQDDMQPSNPNLTTQTEILSLTEDSTQMWMKGTVPPEKIRSYFPPGIFQNFQLCRLHVCFVETE